MAIFSPKQVTFINTVVGDTFNQIFDQKLETIKQEVEKSVMKAVEKLIHPLLERIEKTEEMVKSYENKVTELEKHLAKKDSEIESLENNLSELKNEFYTLKKLQDCNEANAIADNLFIYGPSLVINGEITADSVRNLIRDTTKVSIPSRNFLSVYKVGKKPDEGIDKRPIKLRLSDRATKYEIMQAFRTAKPQGLFISEELTKTRNSLFYKLRKLRKITNIPKFVWTRDGIIKAKKAAEGKTYNIENIDDFNKFILDTGLNLDDYDLN